MPKSHINMYDKICEYGSYADFASDPTVQHCWQKANELYHCSLEKCMLKSRALSGRTSASLYECAAREVKFTERLCYASAARACEHAFCAGVDPYCDDSDFEEEAVEDAKILAVYHNTVAGNILTLEGVFPTLPAELSTFFEQVQQQSIKEVGLNGMAGEHAKHILLQNRCKNMCVQLVQEDPTLDAWRAVEREVDELLPLLHEQAKNAYILNRTCPHLAAQITFHLLVVKCYVAWAEAPRNSATAVVWKEAVDICQQCILHSEMSVR